MSKQPLVMEIMWMIKDIPVTLEQICEGHDWEVHFVEEALRALIAQKLIIKEGEVYRRLI